MMSFRPPNCCLCDANDHALYTDLDVMFCSVADSACFSGQGNILVEPILNETGYCTGYATLFSLKRGIKGDPISSKVIRDQAKHAVEHASVANLPGEPCCYGRCDSKNSGGFQRTSNEDQFCTPFRG